MPERIPRTPSPLVLVHLRPPPRAPSGCVRTVAAPPCGRYVCVVPAFFILKQAPVFVLAARRHSSRVAPSRTSRQGLCHLNPVRCGTVATFRAIELCAVLYVCVCSGLACDLAFEMKLSNVFRTLSRSHAKRHPRGRCDCDCVRFWRCARASHGRAGEDLPLPAPPTSTITLPRYRQGLPQELLASPYLSFLLLHCARRTIYRRK